MHLLRLVILNAPGQPRRVADLRIGLQTFLQLGDTALNRVKHLLRLAAGVAEDNDPLVLAQLLPQSLGIGLKHLVALLQAIAAVIELLTRTWEHILRS